MNAQASSDLTSPNPSTTPNRNAQRRAAGRSGGVFECVPGSEQLYHFRYVKPEGIAPKPSLSPSSDVSGSESSGNTLSDGGPSKWFNVSTFSPVKSYVVRGEARDGRQEIAADRDRDADGELSIDDSQLSHYTVASHEAELKRRPRYTISSRFSETSERHNGHHNRSKLRDLNGLTDTTPSGGQKNRMQKGSHDVGAGARFEVEKDSQIEARLSRFVEHLNEDNDDLNSQIKPRNFGTTPEGSRGQVAGEGLTASQRFFRFGRREIWWK